MTSNKSCTQHRDCEINGKGEHWQLDQMSERPVRYKLILSYSRNENGEMTNLWADDMWAARQVLNAELKGK